MAIFPDSVSCLQALRTAEVFVVCAFLLAAGFARRG
jgi:hypothetical protein